MGVLPETCFDSLLNIGLDDEGCDATNDATCNAAWFIGKPVKIATICGETTVWRRVEALKFLPSY